MPPVAVQCLLRELDTPSEARHEVDVLCAYGLHSLRYTVPVRELERIVPLNKLRAAAPPCQWGAYLSKATGVTSFRPLLDKAANAAAATSCSRRVGELLLYPTVGRYYNALEAEQELLHLPKRGGKKTAVALEAEKEVSDAEVSADTEYDSAGQPLPVNQGRSRKRKRKQPRGKVRVPAPENIAYREDIAKEQANDSIDVYTVNHLGAELCTLLAQMLRTLHDEHQFTERGFAHMYTTRPWLRAVRAQAHAMGNPSIAAAASRLLMQAVRAQSLCPH